MADRTRAVLHVRPHPGGGGETYVDALESLDGYRLDRMFLAAAPRGPGVARAVVRNGLRVPAASRGHDLVHVHGEVAAAVCLPVIASRASVVTLHGLNLLRRVSGAPSLAARLNLRLVVRAADRTICVSELERSELLEAVAGRSAERVMTIPNGVGPIAAPTVEERAAARSSLGLSEERVAGVWLGGLEEHKDPLAAIRAALELGEGDRSIVLLVAGDGPLRPEVERLAAASAGSVRALGFRRDVHRLLMAADFFVNSSRREGSSYSLLEAMALGLPAVVSDAPGNAESVGSCGIVVPRGDVEGFAAAYRELLGDAEGRRALGDRARQRVERDFRLDAMVRRTREVYDAVLATRRRRPAAASGSP